MANGTFEDFEKRLKERYVLLARSGLLAGVGVVLASFAACFFTYKAGIELSDAAKKDIAQIKSQLDQVKEGAETVAKKTAEEVATKIAREVAEGTAAKGALDRIKSYEEIARTSSEKIQAYASWLNMVPAACGELVVTRDKPIYLDTVPDTTRYPGKELAIGTVLPFNQIYYDTHAAVHSGAPWYYEVPLDGVYSVTASVACGKNEGGLALGLHVNAPPRDTRPKLFLASAPAYSSGTMIGGTIDVELTKGQHLDIRAYSMVKGSMFTGAGTTHFSIHWVRPLSLKKN